MSALEKPLRTIFLLGAGASRPAGIQTIDQMTNEFLSNPKLDEDHGGSEMSSKPPLNPIRQFFDVVRDYFGIMDLELIMSLILQLEEPKFRELFSKKYPLTNELVWVEDPDKFYWKNMYNLKMLIQQHIRKECEKIKTVDYLWTLDNIIEKKPINIFTLNYDGTIEIFCEKNNINYSDGFNPYWNSANFDESTEINIFKLHGSLYWIKTSSGKILKIPLKGLRVSELTYLTDEKVSEMMIYPALQKNKQTEVYSWLNQKFKDELRNTDLCVIIGYSFRDDDVKDSLIESMQGNQNLWLLIVSPHASKRKEELVKDHHDFSSRIVTMDLGTEEALRERNLHDYLRIITSGRDTEEKAWTAQAQSLYRFDRDFWNFVLNHYVRVKHHDRIKWIVEKLSKEKFSDIAGDFPECIEGQIGEFSLRYALEYHKKKNKQEYELWKKIFVDFCTVLEYALFDRISIELREENILKKIDLPPWCKPKNLGGSIPNDQLFKLGDEIKTIMSNTQVKTIITPLDKLNDTLELWKRYWEDRDVDVAMEYERNDLGLRGWAIEVVDQLK